MLRINVTKEICEFSIPVLKPDFYKHSLSFLINAAADLMLLKNNTKNAFRECK